MSDTSRIEAQQRADEIRIFRKELNRLDTEGVLQLADTQLAAVSAHHEGLLADFAQSFDIDRDMRSKQMSWGMRIASFLGALALAASVFFLFYQFWGRFTGTAQAAILIGASLGMFALMVWIQGRDASGYFTKLAAMVAFACFMLNVAMLGQIFNITPSDKALLPWAVLALLLAYTCDLRLLLAAGIICIIVYTAARFGTWSGMYWINFGERPENFFPVSLLLFFFPQWVPHRGREDFAPVYRVFAILSLLLPVLILSNWGYISYLRWPADIIENFYQVLGFALSALLVWLGLRRQWGEVVNTGVTFFVIFLYTKFYDWWWETMPKYLFFLVVGLTAVLFLFILKRLRQASNKHLAQKKGGA
jgi:uncharacterized membrane protein